MIMEKTFALKIGVGIIIITLLLLQSYLSYRYPEEKLLFHALFDQIYQYCYQIETTGEIPKDL